MNQRQIQGRAARLKNAARTLQEAFQWLWIGHSHPRPPEIGQAQFWAQFWATCPKLDPKLDRHNSGGGG
jgi:hypothetical protein